jgi:hypothetical protein
MYIHLEGCLVTSNKFKREKVNGIERDRIRLEIIEKNELQEYQD